MKEQADLKSILKAGKLTNELDLERASILDNKLRLLAKDNPELMESRKRLRSIIKFSELKLNKLEIKIKWAEELTGMNSVMPWTIDSKKISIIEKQVYNSFF